MSACGHGPLDVKLMPDGSEACSICEAPRSATPTPRKGAWVLRIEGLVGFMEHGSFELGPDKPMWLRGADVDAHGGAGSLDGTADIDEALAFSTAVDALSFWRQQSTVKPLREDGKPNRPLTAFTMSTELLT